MLTKVRGIAQLPVLLGLSLMALVLPLVSYLAQSNQDNRNRAAYSCSETTHPSSSCVISGVTYGWTCNNQTGAWECKVTAPVVVSTLIPTNIPTINKSSTIAPPKTTPTLPPNCACLSGFLSGTGCSSLYGQACGGTIIPTQKPSPTLVPVQATPTRIPAGMCLCIPTSPGSNLGKYQGSGCMWYAQGRGCVVKPLPSPTIKPNCSPSACHSERAPYLDSQERCRDANNHDGYQTLEAHISICQKPSTGKCETCQWVDKSDGSCYGKRTDIKGSCIVPRCTYSYSKSLVDLTWYQEDGNGKYNCYAKQCESGGYYKDFENWLRVDVSNCREVPIPK